MADPLLRLAAGSVSVQPGGQAQVGVTVTSESDIVEGYRLTVLGAQPCQWAEVVPPTVNVYPGAEATAVVVFSPPSGTASPSGRFPFGVKATSTESPDASAVAEGSVEVGQVSGLQAKIVPVTSTGRWRGRHVIRLDNWGNAPAHLRLVATDPDAALGFYLKPDIVDLPVGGSAVVRLSARARRPFLRGTEVRRPFQVAGEPLEGTPGPAPATPYGNPARPVVDAALAQRPILTRGAVTLAGVLLVAALAGGVYAWTRPQGAPGSLAKLGAPPAPKDFQAVGSDVSSVKLRWKSVDQIDSYSLQHVDAEDEKTVTKVEPIDGSQTSTVVTGLPPASRACFRLRAVRANLPGSLTAAECRQTAAAPASPSPTPPASPGPSATTTQGGGGPPGPPPSSGSSGSTVPSSPGGPSSPGAPSSPVPPGSSQSPEAAVFGPGKWALVASWGAQSVPGGRESVDATTAQLVAKGLTTAQTVDSRQYPRLQIGGTTNDLWISLVGPYDTAEAAQQDCSKVQTVTKFCLPKQPVPS